MLANFPVPLPQMEVTFPWLEDSKDGKVSSRTEARSLKLSLGESHHDQDMVPSLQICVTSTEDGL